MRYIPIYSAVVVVSLAPMVTGCESGLDDLPAPPDAELQARIVAARYIAGGYEDAIDSTREQPYVIYHWRYTQGVTLWALMLLYEQLDDPAYLQQVRASLESWDANGRIRIHGGSDPIDYIGSVAHAIVEYTQRSEDDRFLPKALEAARFFREEVDRTPDGLIAHHSAPERGRIWVDALFMVTPLMAKAGTLLGDGAYYDDVLAQFRGFTDYLRDSDVGLYHQGWGWHGDGASPGYWGRANGWAALAMCGNIDNISPGSSTKSSEEGYLDKKPQRNDDHGIGPVLLALHAARLLQDRME